jgi:hypothetical protein
MAGPTSAPFVKAFACAAIVLIAAVAGAFVTWRTYPTHVGLEFAGELLVVVAAPAAVVGFFARRSAKAWPLWQFVAFYIVALTVSGFVQIASRVVRLQ